MPDARLAGKLLVANPRLADPNFDRSVVLVLAHTDDGALGVILNRPSDTELLDPLPRWSVLADFPSLVFEGGPVSHDSVICLAEVPVPAVLESRVGPDSWRHVAGDVGTLDLDLDPDLIGGAVGSLRVFAGYAGWAAGQLEDELISGGLAEVPVPAVLRDTVRAVARHPPAPARGPAHGGGLPARSRAQLKYRNPDALPTRLPPTA
jgi:putative transcriptional regulator